MKGPHKIVIAGVAGIVSLSMGAISAAQAQNARSCEGVASSDMADSGVIETATDIVYAYKCDGSGDSQQLDGAQFIGKPILNLGPGQFFVPSMGVWVEDIDVSASKKRVVKTTCGNSVAFGSQTSSSAMGHGACN